MDCDEIETEATKTIGKKTADEMFEELGYEKENNSNYICEFYKYGTFNFIDDDDIIFIKFDMKDKDFWKSTSITMQELQAINKKCEELGWI